MAIAHSALKYKPMKLIKNDIITVVGISSWMANTTRSEYKYYGNYQGVDACTKNEKGARKKYHTPNLTNNEKDVLTFLNCNPFKISGEITRDTGTGFTSTLTLGNACLNFYGTVEEVKDIVAQNLNENFRAFDTVMAIDVETDESTPVYPEVPTGHAVVLKERAKQTT